MARPLAPPPAHTLFHEADHLLREDPRTTDRAMYDSVLGAVAAGRTTRTRIAGDLGRGASALNRRLDVLLTAGPLRRGDDVLLQRRPTHRVADPMIRPTRLVTEPQRVLLEEPEVGGAWEAAAPAFSSGALGPHSERTGTEWTSRHAGDRWPQPIGEVGPTVVDDPAGRAQHRLDVVALPRGVPRHTGAVPAGGAALALFARSGFDRDLQRTAARRDDVHLVDLAEPCGAPA